MDVFKYNIHFKIQFTEGNQIQKIFVVGYFMRTVALSVGGWGGVFVTAFYYSKFEKHVSDAANMVNKYSMIY